MEERNEEIVDGGMDVKDSQTLIIKETKQIVLRNVPEDLWIRFRDFCRNYARGNWTRGLQLALDAGEMVPMLNAINENMNNKMSQFETRLVEVENKHNAPVTEKRKELKTFGGMKDE